MEQLVFRGKEKEKDNEALILHLNDMQILTGGNWVGEVGAPGEHKVPEVLSILREIIYSSHLYEP